MKEKFEQFEKVLKDKLEPFFFIDFNQDKFISDLENFEKSENSNFEKIYTAFKDNLIAIVSTIALPKNIAFRQANNQIYSRFLNAEKIRALIIPDDMSISDWEDEGNDEAKKRKDEQEKNAYHIAKDKFFEYRHSETGRAEFRFLTLDIINTIADDAVLRKSAQNLLNQSTLSIWTQIEVIFRDTFVCHLNRDAELVENLIKESELNKKFNLKNLPTELLQKYNYNISKNMGDILIQNFEFSNLSTIKTIFNSLFGSKELNALLKNENLWILFKRRNLIIHKGGIVDEEYLNTTNENLEIGSNLYVIPFELKAYLELAKEIGKILKDVIERNVDKADRPNNI